MTRSGVVDWDFARIVEAFYAPLPTDPRTREIVRRQRADRDRIRQAGRLRTRRDHAGLPVEAAHRLMTRSERLQARITYDPARNNPVLSDPVLAKQVRRAARYYSHCAWALVDGFCRSRIPLSRALVPVSPAALKPPIPPAPALIPGQLPVPQDRSVFILVQQGRAIVARYRQGDERGTYTVQLASNWPALEPDALDAVEAAGGAWWVDDFYPCPPALAARAQFEN
ncbi:hypothetical protein [Aggregatilinea lenta]|uniref:hypothetical protein n=1 Tax=Aggregatilinea lenta TaxID=913108 RepID=UPI000E5A5A05|nr:hypothetical protein [Aggregatilinea lenta]